jgi:hypothetical protein
MEAHETGSVGVLPIGALGVAFYYYLTEGASCAPDRVVFLSRRTGAAGERWREGSSLSIDSGTGRRDIPLAGKLAGSLPEAAREGRLPGIVLVCTNPDQLFDVISEYAGVVEHEHREKRLLAGKARLPLLVLCANGIYYQRIRRSFIELLEESTLLGRLPDLWPHLMPFVVGRLMRGVTIQTAVRKGEGPTAVYRPGPPGRTLLTGGDPLARAAAVRTLTRCGGCFEDAGKEQPTRVEFNKALVNLSTNVFGQLAAIGPDGRFRVLTVGEISGKAQHGRILGLVEAVMQVGRGVGVYRADESVQDIFLETLGLMTPAAAHVPSSLQWLEQQLATASLRPGLAPTEKWLLQPLLHYARSLGDPKAIDYFEGIELQLTEAIARAIAAQAKALTRQRG